MATLQAERLVSSCERLGLRVIPSRYESLAEEAAKGEGNGPMRTTWSAFWRRKRWHGRSGR